MDNILGKCLGTCVINNFLIIFTHELNIDRIYKISKPENNSSKTIQLFSGNLNFIDDDNHKIQTLPFYENDSIQKVYWIDGKNQPRVINIAIEDNRIYNYNNISFDFSQSIELKDKININKILSGGIFKSGILQYMFSYYNESGIESSIFYTSPLLYISPDKRAGKIDEIIDNSFEITLNNLDINFQYVRIYSMYRSSIDSTPEVKKVIDLPVNNVEIKYIDNGSGGEILSTDILLYIGSNNIIPKCMSQKNNTLFFGNIKLNDSIITIDRTSGEDIINFNWIEGNSVQIETLVGNSTFYPYSPESLNSDKFKIKHFKFDETYRLGIQGQYSNGKFSSPIWVNVNGGDIKPVDKRYRSTLLFGKQTISINPIYGQLKLSTSFCSKLINLGFKRIRPVMVPMSMNDRSIIAQGVLTNTLSTMKDRLDLSTNKYSMPDYLTRLNSEQNNGECLRINTGGYVDYQLEIMASGHRSTGVGDTDDYPIGIQTATTNANIYNPLFDVIGRSKRNVWFKDSNFVNFWSPDLIYNKDSIGTYLKSATKISLYGAALNTGYDFNINIDGNWNPPYSGVDEIKSSNPFNIPNYSFSSNSFTNNIHKSLYGTMYRVTEGGSNPYSRVTSHYPMWSPKSISFNNTNGIDNIIFDFTKYSRYNSNYFSVSNILSDDKVYEYDINTPSFMINSGSVFTKTNVQDNNGLVIYNKDVEENYPSNTWANKVARDGSGWDVTNSTTSMQVKYSSNIHAAFSLKNLMISGSEYSQCTPFLGDSINNVSVFSNIDVPYWRLNNKVRFTRKMINWSDSTSNNGNFKGCGINSNEMINSLLIFDIYKEPQNKYGGTSDYALYSNEWIPAGKMIDLVASDIVVDYLEGDTYIQRCDILKTYTDPNQIPSHNETISFICESIINLDGRSDVNRYTKNINLMSNSNFGLFNNIYSQKNNYFNYNILNLKRFNINNFNNTITWSKTKVSGALIDAWSNITMLNTIDLDGVNGEVSSINLFNNDLYAFQDKGVARLLFNERVQQQSSDGVSVELINGYKVPDYRYLTNQYGCDNKWSITEGKNGIYFIDYTNKTLVSIGDGIKDIGSSSGFKSWFNINTIDKDYTLSYDRKNNDLYIHNNDIGNVKGQCLNYSETLQSFVSFYDYVNIPQMKNVWDEFISINTSLDENSKPISNIWITNKGDYNSFYGVSNPFSVEYLINPEPTNDKVFNTIEYRIDNNKINWNNLEIHNWYQDGYLSPAKYMDKLKIKFNVNRVQLPRREKSLDRIRSTWVKLKLSHTPNPLNINEKFSMQDLSITYTV